VKTRWVTSFSNDLYLATGKDLLSSFVDTGSCGTLHVYAEKVPSIEAVSDKIRIEEDPSENPELAAFIKSNSNLIHQEFGGTWSGLCRCPNPHDPKDKRHKPGCPNSWFCKHAIRWFRKVLSVNSFVSNYPNFDRFIWVDSDVVFKKQVLEEEVSNWFSDNNVFFLKGPKRKVWETGVFGVQGTLGKQFITNTLDNYMLGHFRKQPRWDDGYIFQNTAESDKALKTIDLATDASGHADVVPHSPLGKFLVHNKGTHGRGLGIMK